MNSLRSPAPNAGFFNLAPKRNNTAGKLLNTVVSSVNSAVNSVNTAVNSGKGTVSPTVIVLLVVFLAVFISFAVFWRQIQGFLSGLFKKVKVALGGTDPVQEIILPDQNVVKPPEAPQNNPPSDQQKFVEKILPGMKEVFNISSNKYTYYDAEPLCKALGAELATYEQVKQAYAQGADWCNYGWVKGQMAVYPTQQETWEQLQNGSEDQRDACGRPGINGGFFDNPELQYGVNCYGERPPQKDHDVTDVTSGQGTPLSVGGLDFEKKIAKYRGEASSMGILPWNKKTWSS